LLLEIIPISGLTADSELGSRSTCGRVNVEMMSRSWFADRSEIDDQTD